MVKSNTDENDRNRGPVYLEKITDQEVDEVVKEVHRRTNFRYPISRSFKLVLILLCFIAALGLSIFFFTSGESEISYFPAENYSTEQYTFPELEEPSRFYQKLESIETDSIDAVSVYAYNPVTYQVYFEKNIDEKRSIASITKLMSAVIILEQYDLNETVVVTEDDLSYMPDDLAWGVGFEKGDEISTMDAFESMILASYNDSAILLANQHENGYEGFIDEMNLKAELLGMEDTSFVNPNGYDDENNYSTARDIRKLVAYVLKNDFLLEVAKSPRETITVTHKEGNQESEYVYSTNHLLDVLPNMEGLKTGYTESAGPSFVGYFNNSEEDQIVTIILGGNDNRFDLTEDLYYKIVSAYE